MAACSSQHCPRACRAALASSSDGSPVNEDYTIEDLGGGSIKITAFGRSQTFSGVTGIVGNMGNGDNTVRVNSGVTVPITLVGGTGNNTFMDFGSGVATLDLSNGARRQAATS